MKNDLPELMFFSNTTGKLVKEVKVIPKNSEYYTPEFPICAKCGKEFQKIRNSNRKLCSRCALLYFKNKVYGED